MRRTESSVWQKVSATNVRGSANRGGRAGIVSGVLGLSRLIMAMSALILGDGSFCRHCCSLLMPTVMWSYFRQVVLSGGHHL